MSYVLRRIMDGAYLQLLTDGGERWVTAPALASRAVNRITGRAAVMPGEIVVTLPDSRPLLQSTSKTP